MRRGAQLVAVAVVVAAAVGCVSQEGYSGSSAPSYRSADPYHYLCNAACRRAGG